MDHDQFDALARLLAATPSRRMALGALLGGGLAGVAGVGEAKRKRRRTRGRRVAAQAADCANPGPGTNLAGCDFRGDDFSGASLTGANLTGTIFVDATLVTTNLSGVSAKGARFADADLCGARLRSSVLKNADFRGADLTRANLRASVCAGALFTAATFCRTVGCDGAVRDDGCPNGVDPNDVCCTNGDCVDGQTCEDGVCTGCPQGWLELPNGGCALPCTTQAECAALGAGCRCRGVELGALVACVTSELPGERCDPGNFTCPSGEVCEAILQGTFLCTTVCPPPTR